MLQVANLAPLRSRLERVGGLKVSSPEKAVRIAQDLFGERVRKRERGRPIGRFWERVRPSASRGMA